MTANSPKMRSQVPNENACLPERTRSPRGAAWFAAFIALQVAGFGLVSFLPEFLQVEGRMVTVPYRAIELALGLLCITLTLFRGRPRRPFSLSLLLALVFWISYSYRACYEALGPSWPRSIYTPESWEFLVCLFFSTIPAFIVAYLISDISIYRGGLLAILLMSIVSCILSLAYHWDGLTAAHVAARIGANEILGPIWYGHMGATTALLSLFCLVRSNRATRWYIPALGASLILGIAVVLLSASRGPLIALGVLAPIVLFFASERHLSRLVIWALVLGIGMAMVVPTLVQDVKFRGVALDHFFGSTEAFTGGQSTNVHMILMKTGWQLFIDHPLLGGGLFEPTLITYPHNTIIEAFMSTGIFGGTAYLMMLGIATVKAFRLMKRRPEMSWLVILFLQQLIHSQVAGCLYFSPTACALTAAMLAVKLPVRTKSHAHRTAEWRARQFVVQPSQTTQTGIA